MAATLRFTAELDHLPEVRRFVSDEAANLGAEPAALEDMVQAVDEWVTNVIVHGYRGGAGGVEVEVAREEDDLVVRIRDRAPPFDPNTHSPPDLTVPFDRRPPGGLGIHLTRQFTDEMIYRVTPEGANELTLLKKAY